MVEINRSYGLLNIASVPDEYIDFMRFLMCNGYSDREIKVIIDEKMKKNTFITQNTSEYGTVKREERNPDKDNIFYHLVPFGLENGKIILPESYKKLDTDDETIYNLCMYSSNYYFWLLLSFEQRYKLYKLLEKNPKYRIFGYNNEYADFEKLHDILYSLITSVDKTNSLQAIRYKLMMEQEPKKNLHKDFMKMVEMNMQRDIKFCMYKWVLKEILDGDVILESNLKPYLPLIWFFNKENYVYKNIKTEDFLLNGTPQVRTIRYPEWPLN